MSGEKTIRGRRLAPLAAAMSAALLGLARAEAQTTADTTEQLGRVVVTGSNLRRISGETPSPVQVIGAAEMKASGFTSVADVLHSISANNMGSLSQGNASAFGAGGAGISLRGLTVGATLVLIDGHRMASYPMPDDAERDFVDISSIPMDAVERIEVLKDGASAVYGSDAMAGVVNVILKKQFKGVTLNGDYGVSSRGDGQTRHASVTGGVGDLDANGWNAYASLEFRRQSPVLLKDRPYLAISDWSKWGGTPDIFDSNGTPNLAGNEALQLQPQTENLSLMSRLTLKLNEAWTGNLQASVLQSKATQIGVLNDISGGQQSFIFGPANAQNPISNPIGNPYTFMQADGVTPFTDPLNALGPQNQRSNTRSYRLVAELSGEAGGWSIDAAAGLTRTHLQLTSRNFLSIAGFQGALDDGSFTPGQTSAIDAALRERIAPTGRSNATNTLNFISLRGSRDLATLAGGPLSLGLGAEYMKRKLDDTFPAGFASGDQYSPIYSFAVGQQTISAAYAELAAPFTRQFEVDAAARLDHYAGYGNSLTPKLGAKYTPLKQLTLRGTYSQGFRAPNPAETGKAGSTSGVLNPVYDPILCANGDNASAIDPNQCVLYFPQLQVSNPKLKSERSNSFTLGLILEPTDWFNVSIDYYDITIKNQIIAVGLLGQTQINDPAAYGAVIYRAAPDPTIPGATVGPIIYETYPFLNASRTHTRGVDIDLRTRFELGEGQRLKTGLSFTRMLAYDMVFGGTTYRFPGTHGPSFISGDTGTPRDRVQASASWSRGPLELGATLSYISGMSVLDATAGAANNNCDYWLSGTFPNGVTPASQRFCRVPSFTTVGASAKYDVSKALSLRFSVNNVFDRKAPYDLQTFGTPGNGAQSGGAAYNPMHQEGALGRYFTVGGTYTF